MSYIFPNKLLSVTLLVLMAACHPKLQKSKEPLSIIPQPNEMHVHFGSFILDAKVQLVALRAEQKKTAQWFSEEIKKSFGLNCPIVENQKSKKSIFLIHDNSLVHEAYKLDINSNNITIKASSEAGYFYAFQTILQIAPIPNNEEKLKKISLKNLSITDEPRFKWRGALLDISRHFFGPASIKQLIDQMATQKMNRLHLHLTDDPGWRIEIKEYPKLHQIGSLGDRTNPNGTAMYLTEQEARDITTYANERQIMIIPEVDAPGHSGAIERAYPEFSGGNKTLNIANDDAVKMIETVILRLADIFNTKYIHFGSDEVRHHNWEIRSDMKAKMKELNLKNQLEFEGWFDRRMSDYIVKSGLKPIAWDEAAGFGVNKKTILQWWRGEFPEVLKTATQEGYDVILSPVDFLYIDYPSHLLEAGANWEGLHNGPNSLEAIYKWKPIPDDFSEKMASRILGMEAGIWTEFISDQKRLEYMIYPRLAAVAEKAWTHEKHINWDSFQGRMTKQYARYIKAGINYRIPNISIDERKTLQPEAFKGPIGK